MAGITLARELAFVYGEFAPAYEETSEPGTNNVIQSIVGFLESKDYSARGSTARSVKVSLSRSANLAAPALRYGISRHAQCGCSQTTPRGAPL